jgi:hypothetical protein
MIVSQFQLQKKKVVKKTKRSRIDCESVGKNCSQHGNSGNSYKSMKSYILGDLAISSNEEGDEETNSFEISSNSSQN